MKEKIIGWGAIVWAGVSGVFVGIFEFISGIPPATFGIYASVSIGLLSFIINWIYKHFTLKALLAMKEARNYPDPKKLHEQINRN